MMGKTDEKEREERRRKWKWEPVYRVGWRLQVEASPATVAHNVSLRGISQHGAP
jgi:hypothetical protein